MKHGGGRRCKESGCEIGGQSGGYCAGHSARCAVKDCDTAALAPPLCLWHDAHGCEAVNDANWYSKTRRLYVVYWRDLGIIKMGVEASLRSRRIHGWLAGGAELVSDWELPSDVDATTSLALKKVEFSALAILASDGWARPEPDDWVQASIKSDASAMSGFTESFKLESRDTSEMVAVLRGLLDASPILKCIIRKTHSESSCST